MKFKLMFVLSVLFSSQAFADRAFNLLYHFDPATLSVGQTLAYSGSTFTGTLTFRGRGNLIAYRSAGGIIAQVLDSPMLFEVNIPNTFSNAALVIQLKDCLRFAESAKSAQVATGYRKKMAILLTFYSTFVDITPSNIGTYQGRIYQLPTDENLIKNIRCESEVSEIH